MFNLATNPAGAPIKRAAFLSLLACAGLSSQPAEPASAGWFPDPPTARHYAWFYQPCSGCEALATRPEWAQMARLAGLSNVRFLVTRDDSNGPAYSAAPNAVVLTPITLKLAPCQLAFVIGHELAHIAQRHYDEDAIALSVFSGKPMNWTDQGEAAMQLAEGDFGLALRVSHLWQEQENEADWMGALLAAQASGCSIESSALTYLRLEIKAGGGIAAAHMPSAERMRRLLPYVESARRLVEMQSR